MYYSCNVSINNQKHGDASGQMMEGKARSTRSYIEALVRRDQGVVGGWSVHPLRENMHLHVNIRSKKDIIDFPSSVQSKSIS